MPTPRHRQRALRQRRRVERRVILAALVAVVVAGLVLAARRGDDGNELTAARSEPTGEDTVAPTDSPPSTSSTTTTTSVPTTSSTAPPSTSTTTTSAPAPAPSSTWYAVVLSGPEDGTNREALRREAAKYGERGRVVDTDDYRTGDGQAPDYLPAPGVVAAVVGPFASRSEVQSWCAGHDGDQGCHPRQLLPRSVS